MRPSVKRIAYAAHCSLGLITLSTLCFFLLPWLVSILRAQAAEEPPDLGYELSRCTRAEIQLEPSTLDYVFPDDEMRTLLSPEEKKTLESMKTLVSTSQEDIKDVAMRDLTMGYYVGRSKGAIGIKNRIRIIGYDNGRRMISFMIIGTVVRTDNGHEFRYDGGLRHLYVLMSQVWPYVLRFRCAQNLSVLRQALSDGMSGQVHSFPTQWCDAVVRQRRDLAPGGSFERSPFECASAQTSHYAMNSDCKPESPADTVLLFETKPGWNQHGGPELFTFNNHDPKGGLVLLNDGTVKFIRTEGELKQLRWK